MTGATFVLGLMIGQFLPNSWVFDQIPVRLDFPFRAASIGAFASFTSIGFRLLPPFARKLFLIVMLALIPVLIAAGVALFRPMFSSPEFDFDALGRILPIVKPVVYSAIGILMLGPAFGWYQWSKSVFRDDPNP